MHISFIYTFPINPLRGGVERVTDILTKEFQRRGIKVSFISFVKMEEIVEYAAPQYFSLLAIRTARKI